MRVLYVVAGAGGMYCGACSRDMDLIANLRARGNRVHVLPVYTPVRLDGHTSLSIGPLFFGGINLSLQHRFPFFRRLHPALDRILDNTHLLKFVSRFAINTKAAELGEMTVGVLLGVDGPFRKEFDRFLAYLAGLEAPEVVVITNTMLSSLAPALKQRYQAPILSQVQGEDEFVGVMPEPYCSRARELMRANCRHIDLFVAPNEAYAAQMVHYLDVPKNKMRVIRTGLDATAYAHNNPRLRNPFTVGYLSGIMRGKGLDLLVEACRQLVKNERREVRLLVGGRVLDPNYWRTVRERAQAGPLEGRFEYLGELSFREKVRFFQRCSAFSVPSRLSEPRGRAMMEALASRVPIVAPESGVFPEMLSLTGGGLLFRPGDARDLAAKLSELMNDPELADRLGEQGARGIAEHYRPDLATDAMGAALHEARAAAAAVSSLS